MNSILIAVLIVAAVGLVAGIGLAIASIVMAVPVDEKAVKIEEILPGANCGACGFSGCAGYAGALSAGDITSTALCTPGGADVAREIADYLGLIPESVLPMTAMVMCNGVAANTPNRFDYNGVQNCKMAAQLYGGPKQCTYGCIGLGDCALVCENNAIRICDGVARINPIYCIACKKCMDVCPKHIIDLVPTSAERAAVMCTNTDKGAKTRKDCKAGCIGCAKCVKVCEYDAIVIENFVAKVDYDKCNGCGKCHTVCPVGCIDLLDIKINA